MKVSDEIRKVADEYDVLPLYKLADRIRNLAKKEDRQCQ